MSLSPAFLRGEKRINGLALRDEFFEFAEKEVDLLGVAVVVE